MREVSSPNAWVAPFTPHMLQLLSKSLIVGVVVICFYGGNNCVVHNFKIFWIENPVTQKYQSRISFLSYVFMIFLDFGQDGFPFPTFSGV